MSKRKSVLEASECHTLDRTNFRAQRDSCGIGPGDTLDSAITAMFEVNYHAWVQNSDVFDCISKVFDDSLLNQSKMGARTLLAGVSYALFLTISGLLYI
jgi:hypothetical protein